MYNVANNGVHHASTSDLQKNVEQNIFYNKCIRYNILVLIWIFNWTILFNTYKSNFINILEWPLISRELPTGPVKSILSWDKCNF